MSDDFERKFEAIFQADEDRRDVKYGFLKDALFEDLHNIQGGKTNRRQFKVRILKLLERYEVREKQRLKVAEARSTYHLKKLEKSLLRSLSILGEMHPDALQILDTKIHLEQLGSILMKSDPAVSIELPEITALSSQLSTVLGSVREEIKTAVEKKGRPVSNAALTELLLDLGATFENGSGKLAVEHCFFNGASSLYQGQFYDFVEKLLKAYDPKLIFSNGALGKAIKRALTSEDSP
ncbi:hypothetical protein [Sulfitobacter sp.]|uniref:hypothetical protein n=1 Tax=Sulfitobacter sp. TaxID=1903071 RepID=UPI003001EF77